MQTVTHALGCFPLRTVAFRGHGFSLLEKTTLRGLQTRAGTAITRPIENLCSRRSQRSSAPNSHHKSRFNQAINKSDEVAKHKTSEGNTRRLLEKENRFFCVRCISKKLSLSCWNSGQSETSPNDSSRRLTCHSRKA